MEFTHEELEFLADLVRKNFENACDIFVSIDNKDYDYIGRQTVISKKILAKLDWFDHKLNSKF